MSPTYASDTQVTSDRSIAEIRRTVQRYGAEQFAFMEGAASAAVAFVLEGRQVRFSLDLPDRSAAEFRLTPTGKERSATSTAGAYEQAVRQRWRALALVVKAKLEAVEAGICTFEQEFLAHLVLPEGDTLYERITPSLELAFAGHAGPMLAITSGGAS